MLAAAAVAMIWTIMADSAPRLTGEPLPDYDYIVVGGGTAGCLIAAELSRNESICSSTLRPDGSQKLIIIM